MLSTCCNGCGKHIFFLVGFPALQDFQTSLFIMFLLFFLLVLVGNAVIVTVAVVDHTLHKPMYFFLINLSVLGVLFITTTISRMLAMFLDNAKTILFQGCYLQMYSFHGLMVNKALLLLVMAYDRYEATCNPFHYPVKMTRRMNIQLAASAWITALIIPVPIIMQTSRLAYGHTARVHHCFCDHLAVVQATCSDFSADFQTFLGFSIAMTVSVIPLLLVTLSYVHIILSVLKINSKGRRMRAFSTSDIPVDVHVMSNIVFSILTPLLIYTLRNKEVKSAVKKSILKILPL
uniref:G-protein coupled receptors family 1 profile domain-containing protein n=1 Tax=Falco tinnunculus TaxID=100819 RepID=A0A8C4ULX7_FALTI